MKQIDLVLEKPEGNSSSAYAVKLHGALMRLIDLGLADEFHQESLRPYSLFTVEQEDGIVLRLSALSEKGYPLIDVCEKVKEFHLSGHRNTVRVLQRFTYDDVSLDDMSGPVPAAFKVVFASPSTYKQKDRFQNWLFLPPLLTSAADKLRVFEGVDVSNNVLNAFSDAVMIIEYNLRSVRYYVKKESYIKGFQGEIECGLTEPESDISSAFMLLIRYARYCGIGAKTALGMGGILLSQWYN